MIQKKWTLSVLIILTTIPLVIQSATDSDYKIGVGIGDITGPAAEINMVSKKKAFTVNPIGSVFFCFYFGADL